MKLRTVRQLCVDGIINIFRNRLVSFVTFVTILISLTIFSSFFVIINVSKANIDNLQDKVEVVAFIENDTKENEVKKMQKEIEELSIVENVNYVSAEEGIEKYKESFEEEGDSEMERIINQVVKNGRNPVPASFEIKLVDNSKNKELKEELSKYDEIYKVNDSNIITSVLSNINKTVKIAGGIAIAVLGCASVLLIMNTIKISLYTRKKEIGIMKYIGATNNFIRFPFIVEGSIIGLIGAVLSIGIVSGVYSLIVSNASSNLIMGSLVYPDTLSLIFMIAPFTFLIAIVMGVAGSWLSIKKYLKV